MSEESELTGAQIVELEQLFAKRFTVLHELDTTVLLATGDGLYDYTADTLGRKKQIHDLVNALKGSDDLRQLAQVAWERSPNATNFRNGLTTIFPDLSSPMISSKLSLHDKGQRREGAPKLAAAPGFQRNIRPLNPMLSPLVWKQKLTEVERRVCRIEVGLHKVGTGFLVGPSVVLTNFHVLKSIENLGGLREASCRFDHLEQLDGGVSPGLVVPMKPGAPVSTRPYAPAEETGTPDDPPPTSDQIDYALLDLTKVPDGERGHVVMPSAPPRIPQEGSPLYIMQHPHGGAMVLAADTGGFIGAVHNGLRLRYHNNTERGSSGSPVFDSDWRPLALHHHGAQAHNQGIPLTLIRSAIESDGQGNLLGN